MLLILSSFSDGPVCPMDEVVKKSPPDQAEILPTPETNASFLSQLTYWWYTQIAIKGWKKTLNHLDRWSLPKNLTTPYIFEKFTSYLRKKPENEHFMYRKMPSEQSIHFQTNMEMRRPSRDNLPKESVNELNVAKIIATIYYGQFFGCFLSKLAYEIIQFFIPVLLKYLIQFVESSGKQPLWHGLAISFAMFLVSTMKTLLENLYFYFTATIGMKSIGLSTAAIYNKSLNLSGKARKHTTTGAIVNLMSVDTKRIRDAIPNINFAWSSPMTILFSVYLLYNELGYSALVGFTVMLLIIPVNVLVASNTKRMQAKSMRKKDERVKFLNEIINGIRIIKYYAWEGSFMDKIGKLREEELQHLRNILYLNTGSRLVSTCAPVIVSIVTFSFYVMIQGEVLTAQKAFVSLTLFNILRTPLLTIPRFISSFITALVSVKRINSFLNSDDLSPYIFRIEEDAVDNNDDVITVENGYFRWESYGNGSDERHSMSSRRSTNDTSMAHSRILNESPRNASISSDLREISPDEGFYLRNINLRISEGSFVAIVGTVGSGKSSLLSALLGEMECIKGQVRISSTHGNTAYVAQQAWIQNTTLKNNILFGSAYNRVKYERTIRACALGLDISYLPGGDETEIGEKGINLSGGQKQRVSLARACYTDADVYFLDDPLSAVDAHVAKHLFDNVLSSQTGILRDKTRILVTNRLDLLPFVDNIIVLDNGEISEMGTYDDLKSSGTEFSKLMEQFNTVEEEISEQKRKNSCADGYANTKNDIVTSCTDEEAKRLIKTEKTETGSVSWNVYIEYLKRISFIWFAILILCHITSNGFALGSNTWLSKWSSSGDKISRNETLHFLSIYAALGGIQGFFTFFGSMALVRGFLRASISFHKDLLYRVLRSPMSFFDTTPSGRIVNRFAKDIDAVDSDTAENFEFWLYCFLNVLSTLIIISIQTPWFTVSIIPIGLVYGCLQRIYLASSRQFKRLESVARSPVFSDFEETLCGISTIRAFGAQDRFIDEFLQKVDLLQSWAYLNYMGNRWLAVSLEFCGNLIVLASSVFATLARHSLSGGSVGLSISYAVNVNVALNYLVRTFSLLEMNIISVERVLEYCKLPSEADWFVDKVTPEPEWPEHGRIVFDEYATRYRAGLDLVIHDLSVEIKPKEKIGIVGRTGAGKSTITQSLFRLIEPAEGKIMIDNHDITDIPLNYLRSRLAIIPQDPVLFSGSLRFNLDPFDKYSEAEIWESLGYAHLRNFVVSLSGQLQYQVAEKGSNLSIGQRQMLCLARALLKKPKILLLDEATAAIDMETDALIQKTIRQEMKSCTVITIAHRLNTIMDSDRVIVLDHGSIKECDSPSRLINDPDTVFYSLAKEANLVK
ncbi:multidrug resistance-associated protein 1-like [Brevipalpus obovatus]|uniref:multidrug resistance-associated protein 1-like n=1 Tax=Brevipalpus obovatus TaxID=246614 RepID=UPI003D9E27E8